MRVHAATPLASIVALIGMLIVAAPAYAEQPADWFIGSGEEGTNLNLDFIFGALQGGIEHREEVFGGANMFTTRASALAALTYGSTQADIEMRLVNLTLGVSFGYQSFWRAQTYGPYDRMDRKERRERDAAGEFSTENFPFWEGRASMGFLINDYVAFNHITAYRDAGMPDRTFDNVTSVVHDGETITQDFQLALHHRDYGAFVPTFRILHFDLNDRYRLQFNWGFSLVSRAGLVRRDDLILMRMFFHSGPIFGAGIDNRDQFGTFVLRGPLTLIFAYRTSIEL